MLAGGASTGLLAVVVGSLARPLAPGAVISTVFLIVAGVILFGEIVLGGLTLPQNRRQVPPWIVRDGTRMGPLQFGYELGTGLRSYVPSSLPHLALVAVLLQATWAQGLIAGLAFGSGRAAMTLARYHHGDTEEWDRGLVRRRRPIRLILGISAAVAVYALVRVPLGLL
jgi:sulfite exporter TauE/SafE